MAKKVDTKFTLVRKAPGAAPVAPSPAAAPASAAPQEVVYSFPSKSRCPRCGTLDTKRTGSYADTQYRECKAPICGKKYSVVGTRL